MAEPCQVCSVPSTKQCSRCKFAHYCSPEHSASDWKRHKLECPIIAAGIESQVGYPLKVKAALFPVEGGEARIIDLPYKLVQNFWHPHIVAHELDVASILGGATPSRTRIEVNGFPTGAPLGRMLLLYNSDNAIAENKPLNKCVQELHQGRVYAWRDNMFAVRVVNTEDRSTQYQDVTAEDLEAVKNYLRQGGNGSAALAPERAQEEYAMLRDMGSQFVSV